MNMTKDIVLRYTQNRIGSEINKKHLIIANYLDDSSNESLDDSSDESSDDVLDEKSGNNK